MNNDTSGLKEYPLTSIFTNNTTQSVASGSTTRLAFNSTELDQAGYIVDWTPGVYTVTLNRSGKLQVLFATNAYQSGASFQGIYFYKNGVQQNFIETRASTSLALSLSWMFQCTAGDVLYFTGYLNGASPVWGMSGINNRLVLIYHSD